jgi:hypothetical protein
VTVTAAEEKNTGERQESQTEAQRSRVKGGELHRIELKLWEGLSSIRRGWSGLSTVDREFAGGEEHRWRRCSAARGEMQMQEREKWREGKLLKVLDQKRRKGGYARALATTAARWRPGSARAEARWCGARGRRIEKRS